MTEIKIPVLPGAKTVMIGKINVSAGSTVTKDTELFTVETKKGARAVKAQADGIISGILIKEGEEVNVNAPAMILEEQQAQEISSITVKMPPVPGTKTVKIGRIAVKAGDRAEKGTVLFEAEGKKGNVSVKAPETGTVSAVLISEGQEISAGTECVSLSPETENKQEAAAKPAVSYTKKHADVLIIGGGTGGYVAAIKAARAGKKTILVENNILGGTCLNVGCIPTKTLIASAHKYYDAVNAGIFGIEIEGTIRPDMKKIIGRKNAVVDRLVGGIEYLMEKNHVEVLNGTASFENNTSVTVTGQKQYRISFDDCIIATGSSVMKPAIEGIDGRLIMDSTKALSETELPSSVVIVGGGVIGLEFAFLYRNLGTEVTIVEFMDRLISVMDEDICAEILRIATEKGIRVELGAKVTSFTETINGTAVTSFEKNGKKYAVSSDRVLVAIGRKSNTEGLGLENTDIAMNPGNRGIAADSFMRTSVPHIYAVGDVNNKIQLAHAASYEGMIAVDHILGNERPFDKNIIPSVIFTMPEIASVGMSRTDADKAGVKYHEGTFHYTANGKALTMNETEGFIRILADEEETVIGAAIIGADASTLIAALGICVANRLKVADIENTVFAHPTTAEVIHEAGLDLAGGAYHE